MLQQPCATAHITVLVRFTLLQWSCRATDTGFVVNNVHVRGPVIAYGGLWLMWRVSKLSDVTPDSLSLLHVLKPVPDLLVFGSGADRDRPPPATLAMLQELNVGIESLPTVRANACVCVILPCPGTRCSVLMRVAHATHAESRRWNAPCG